MTKILLGNVKGPKGDTGPQGKQGVQGPQGPAGALARRASRERKERPAKRGETGLPALIDHKHTIRILDVRMLGFDWRVLSFNRAPVVGEYFLRR